MNNTNNPDDYEYYIPPLIDSIMTPRTHINTIIRIIQSGEGSVNEREPRNGNTPLHLAAKRIYSIDIMRVLLDYGADVNAENNAKVRPLSIAIEFNQILKVELLIEKGANINILDDKGQNLLFSTDNIDILTLLIEKGLNINSTGVGGRTPLHWVIIDLTTILGITFKKFLFLIENGANINIRDFNGKTPLDYAQVKNTYLNQQLLNPGLTEDDTDELKKELIANNEVIRILINKMNSIIPPESQSWSGYSYDNDDCSICYEELSNGNSICINKNCEHGYHCVCINKWLNTINSYTKLPNNNCPMCRARLEIAPLDELQQRAIQNSFGKKRSKLGIKQLNAYKKYLDSL